MFIANGSNFIHQKSLNNKLRKSNILSRLYASADESTKRLMEEHFGAACKYEYDLWEMAYNNTE